MSQQDKMREELIEIEATEFPLVHLKVEKIMAWVQRWRGRPSEAEILRIHAKHCVCAGCSHYPGNSSMVRELVGLYAPSPSVSREEISQVLVSNNVMLYSAMPADASSRKPYEERRERLLDDLCHLIGILEEKPKVWCDHISFRDNHWLQVAVEPVSQVSPVGTFWEICPVCAKPKPRPA